MIKNNGIKDMKVFYKEFPLKDAEDILMRIKESRYYKGFSRIKKKPWTPEEDEHLVSLVNKYGAEKWSIISSYLCDREGKQCRERWHNHLNPNISKSLWTSEEEWHLYMLHALYGNSWSLLSKSIIGRTDNNIKNHWNSSMHNKIVDMEEILSQKMELYSNHRYDLLDDIENNLIGKIMLKNKNKDDHSLGKR